MSKNVALTIERTIIIRDADAMRVLVGTQTVSGEFLPAIVGVFVTSDDLREAADILDELATALCAVHDPKEAAK